MTLPMFFESATGISNAIYGVAKRYQFGFVSGMVQLLFKSGTGPIYYSFDGTNDHGILNNTAGSIQKQILEPFNTARVYLRGGDGTEIIEISATPRAT